MYLANYNGLLYKKSSYAEHSVSDKFKPPSAPLLEICKVRTYTYIHTETISMKCGEQQDAQEFFLKFEELLLNKLPKE